MAGFLDSYIADGFADDCEELIHQCLKEVPVTYSSFCKVFRSLQMSSVFQDRHSGAEIAELSEELIHIAKYYMVANTSTFESTIVGLFLVYALLKLQPFENFAYLRLCDEDVPYLERMGLVARRDKRLDVLYVLGRVLTENTRFCAAARERGMEQSYRKYLENYFTWDNIGQRPKGVFLRQNEELDIIQEISELQLRYDAAKATVNVPELKYVDTEFANELDASLRNIITGIINNKPSVETEEENVEESARSIKDRAMKIKVDPMRHLIGVEQRSPRKTNKSHVSDIKARPGKIKTGSPRKQLLSNMRKNPTNTTKTRAKKRKRSEDSSDTSDESDLSLELSDHDSDDDIDLENFNKVQPTHEVSNNETENITEVEIDSKNIRLGGLPCIITSEDDGKSYEIEIIDRLNESTKNSNERPGPKREYRVAIDNEMQARKEKRDLKKTVLKSRFKRMGMEPIVEFKST